MNSIVMLLANLTTAIALPTLSISGAEALAFLAVAAICWLGYLDYRGPRRPARPAPQAG